MKHGFMINQILLKEINEKNYFTTKSKILPGNEISAYDDKCDVKHSTNVFILMFQHGS